MISFKDYLQEKKKDPCWTGYEAIGMKDKNGKKVPNCVPVKESVLNPNDPHEDYKEKSKVLHQLSLDKNVDQKEVTQRKLDLDKEYAKIKEDLDEATYQGKTVPLNKPMAGDVKKSKVYVDPDGDGKAKKVNFGDKNMTIKKNIPARRKSFRARHNCENPGPKDKARYWSCKAW